MSVDIKEEIKKMLAAAGVTGEIKFSSPPKPEMGDLAFACFDVAKIWKMSPAEAAKKIETEILRLAQNDKLIEKAVAFGPYVNFFINAGEAAKIVLGEVAKKREKFGINKDGRAKKVLFEYPSNNTHKELHVGHLRNICLGNALNGLYTASGYKTISVNYVNDFGAHVARCLWWIMKKDKIRSAPEGREQAWLGEMYAEASRYLSEHPESADEVAECQKKLEKKDREIWPLFLKTRAWSLAGFKKAFKELGVKHKAVFYESKIKKTGQKMVDELLGRKIASVGEGGAIIADLNKWNLEVGLLRKSNGAGLYLTSDLGLAVVKNKKYKKLAESVTITGSEQSFYFKQLFKILELYGCKFKMTHIGYGLVNLPTGKISSRAGNVVLYDDLKKMVERAVLEKSPELAMDRPRLERITFAAIKFDFLKHEAGKVITFNEKEAASFDGFSGPYVLYVIARVNSLFKKFGAKKAVLKNLSLLRTAEEKKIILDIDRYAEAAAEARRELNPSVLTRYCFELSQDFNDFYAKHSVLGGGSAELNQARIALSCAVAQVLKNALRVLGIEPVETM